MKPGTGGLEPFLCLRDERPLLTKPGSCQAGGGRLACARPAGGLVRPAEAQPVHRRVDAADARKGSGATCFVSAFCVEDTAWCPRGRETGGSSPMVSLSLSVHFTLLFFN